MPFLQTRKRSINVCSAQRKNYGQKKWISVCLPLRTWNRGWKLVLATIYLLFNEGYYSVSQNKTLRKELCFEAMRLCKMLVENEATNTTSANALLSLMCFHASRFEARFTKSGETVLYDEQDTGLWNPELISQGGYYLNRSANGDRISQYHLEAGLLIGVHKKRIQKKNGKMFYSFTIGYCKFNIHPWQRSTERMHCQK